MNIFKLKIASMMLVLCLIMSGCGKFAFPNSKVENMADKTDEEIEEHDTIIVGGGITGLTSGYYLKEQDFILLEQSNTVGGRTVSEVHKDFSYAKGTEYLGTPESTLAQMIDELGLEPKEIPSPMDAYFDGKEFYYGHDGVERYLINNSSFDDYKKFTKLIADEYQNYDELPELDYNKRMKQLDHITASKWLKDNDIPEVYSKKYNVTAKGLFGATIDEISALNLIPEVAFDYDETDEELTEEAFAARNTEEAIRQEYENAKKEESGSYSFTKGLTELTNKLGDVLGDKVRTSSTVTNISKDGKEYVITYAQNDGKEKKVRGKNVILAVPAPEALRIAADVISKEKKDIMKNIEYASYATVALFSDEPIFNKAFDLAVPDGYYFTDVYDATWVERAYDETKENADGYIMSVYVAPESSSNHELDTISDQELLDNIYRDLDKIFESASSKITGHDIKKFTYGYPVMNPGAYERLLKLHELNEGSLILAGDYMVYPTFEAAVQSGYLASEKINE